jgi:hypothetical protein
MDVATGSHVRCIVTFSCREIATSNESASETSSTLSFPRQRQTDVFLRLPSGSVECFADTARCSQPWNVMTVARATWQRCGGPRSHTYLGARRDCCRMSFGNDGPSTQVALHCEVAPVRPSWKRRDSISLLGKHRWSGLALFCRHVGVR